MTNNPFEDRDLEYDPFENELTTSEPASESALSQDEFERLLEGARSLEPLYDLQAEFVILLSGRLGMRRGEITHLEKDWVDQENERIHVPQHEPCKMGKDGGLCGLCRNAAKQMADINDVPFEEVAGLYWKAKTSEAERDIPYGWSDQCKNIINEFFDEFDGYYASASSITRRVEDSLEAAEGLDSDDTTPHGLRATAASYHASRGLNVWGLQGFMGWAYPQTAQHYVVYEGERIEKSLDDIHNVN